MRQLVSAAQLLFGLWMLANGVNHVFLPLWPEPAGHEPLAIQLMDALTHSRLFDVAMGIQLVTGALLLGGLLAPLALCIVMPVNVCAAFWSVILERAMPGALLSLGAVALNALLMLAYLDYYRGVLVRHTPTLGEA